MTKLLILLAVSTALAYFSQQNTVMCYQSGIRYRCSRDWAYVLLVTILVFFSGLRVAYNDTENYINMFRSAPFLLEYLQEENSRTLFHNPTFYLFVSFFKSIANQENLFLFVIALFNQLCFIWFIKRYASNFTFSIFLYFTLGTYCFTMAATKQVLAMSLLMLAMPLLERKKWIAYYLMVFLAMTVHVYALAYAILPLFRVRPWKTFTCVFLLLVTAVLLNFEDVITAFLSSADELVTTNITADTLNDTSLNFIRVLVYAAAPVMSLLLRRWLFRDSTTHHHVLVHMSIISFAFMLLGTQNGANVFARMGTYFELGIVCCLPWMIPRSFTKRSAQLVTFLAVAFFLGYFIYDFSIAKYFADNYRAITIWEFLQRILT